MLVVLGVLAAAVAAVLVIGLLLALVGAVVGLVFAAVALVFKMLPVLIVGYVAVKLLRRGEGRPRELSTADRAWLDHRV